MGQSEIEALFEAIWERDAPSDIPPLHVEYPFNVPHTKHRFDFAEPLSRVAVECDGGQHQRGGGRHNTDLDRWKMNLAAALGWRVLHFSREMLQKDPERCINLVVQAIRCRRL